MPVIYQRGKARVNWVKQGYGIRKLYITFLSSGLIRIWHKKTVWSFFIFWIVYNFFNVNLISSRYHWWYITTAEYLIATSILATGKNMHVTGNMYQRQAAVRLSLVRVGRRLQTLVENRASVPVGFGLQSRLRNRD
jgi:hypothetical protein